MDETYRMLARERSLDFEREAQRRRLAATLPPKSARAQAPAERARIRSAGLLPLRLTAWLTRSG